MLHLVPAVCTNSYTTVLCIRYVTVLVQCIPLDLRIHVALTRSVGKSDMSMSAP
jgi:hypothetical protein